MQTVRQRMHSGAPRRRADGVVGRLLRSLLQLRASQESGCCMSQLHVVSKVRFRDPQVEMAHGAGGKASRRLIDGLFAPLLYEAQAPGEGDRLSDAARVLMG